MNRKSYSRADRVAQLVHRELANIMMLNKDNVYFSQISITVVEMSRDLSHAKIYVTISRYPKEIDVDTAVKFLNSQVGFLRHALAKNLLLRVIPELFFIYDKSVVDGAKLSALIDSAIAEDESKKKD